MKKDTIELLDYLSSRPIGPEGVSKYLNFLKTNEKNILKKADQGVIPLNDANKDIIKWVLPIDEDTKVKGGADDPTTVDLGFGKITLPLVKFSNEVVDKNGNRSTQTGYTFSNTDTEIILRFMIGAIELAYIATKMDGQVRALPKEFRHIGHMFLGRDGAPLIGYGYLESYYGMPGQHNPNTNMKELTADSDIKRFSFGNMLYYLESKKDLFTRLLNAVRKNNIEETIAVNESVKVEVGEEDFSVNDQKNDYRNYTQNVDDPSYAKVVENVTGGKPTLETLIITGSNNTRPQVSNPVNMMNFQGKSNHNQVPKNNTNKTTNGGKKDEKIDVKK